MQRLLMAYHAVVGRSEARSVVTPGAVAGPPVGRVRARRCLVVAADAVILAVAVLAPVSVACSLEPVAQGAPGVRVIFRHHGIVAFHAVVPLMADITGLAPAPCFVHGEIGRGAVILEPVALVRVRHGEGDLLRSCPSRSFAPGRRGRHEAEEGREAEHQDNRAVP